MKTINQYIKVIHNVLSPTLCDEIVEEYKNDTYWIDAKVISNHEQGNINFEKRNCKLINISSLDTIQKNKEKRLEIDKNIFNKVGTVLSQYNEEFKINCVEDSGYELLCYKTGGFFTKHIDSHKHLNRVVSCSFALNDEYTGGEFAFFDKTLKFQLKKGDAIIFPSNFMYPHEVMPILSGERYSMVTWFI